MPRIARAELPIESQVVDNERPLDMEVSCEYSE